MAEKLLIRPKEGLIVKDPRNGMPLPAERNTAVDANQFWLRRIQAGDVVIGKKEPIMPPIEEKKKVFKKKKSEENQDSE